MIIAFFFSFSVGIEIPPPTDTANVSNVRLMARIRSSKFVMLYFLAGAKSELKIKDSTKRPTIVIPAQTAISEKPKLNT